MSLTASDETTGAVIFPFDQGRSRAVCRDDTCRAVMEAVHEVSEDRDGVKVTTRRAYWRHRASADAARRCKSSRSDKTVWHIDWQMRCTDPDRIEHRVGPVGKCRIADVFTKFGWALEFQHSNIDKTTVARRENHYRGRVLWIVNGHPSDGLTGQVDHYRGNLRWTGVKPWVIEAKTLMSVDDGFVIHLLPPGGLRQYLAGEELLIPVGLVKTMSHEDFTSQWINGDTMPLGGQPLTEWYQLATTKARKSRDQAMADGRLTASSLRKEQADPRSEVCAYGGDRARLVYPDGQPMRVVQIGRTSASIPVCRNTGCPSAASTSGWCHSHTPVEVSA